VIDGHCPDCGRPVLWDFYCCDGGAGEGYRLAGFCVRGFDIDRHDYPPGLFVHADALEVLGLLVRWGSVPFLGRPAAVHASPPCHDHSDLAALSGQDGTGDLLGQTRDLLEATGLPYVIENVEGAPMFGALILCGSEFDLWADCSDGVRRQLRRHRLFESNVWLMGAGGCHHKGQPVGVYGTGGGGHMTRGYKGNLTESRQAMGMPWASRADVSQAIPPRFTEHIGGQLLAALDERLPAA
jgi:DNA (cytosine-5)-methyltransferase 1